MDNKRKRKFKRNSIKFFEHDVRTNSDIPTCPENKISLMSSQISSKRASKKKPFYRFNKNIKGNKFYNKNRYQNQQTSLYKYIDARQMLSVRNKGCCCHCACPRNDSMTTSDEGIENILMARGEKLIDSKWRQYQHNRHHEHDGGMGNVLYCDDNIETHENCTNSISSSLDNAGCFFTNQPMQLKKMRSLVR